MEVLKKRNDIIPFKGIGNNENLNNLYSFILLINIFFSLPALLMYLLGFAPTGHDQNIDSLFYAYTCIAGILNFVYFIAIIANLKS